jgi:hypothetical protein
MVLVICKECQQPFEVPYGTNASICSNCFRLKKTLNSQNLHKKDTDIKVGHKVKFSNDEQILSALESVGDAFRSAPGGANLMLTEHVENGIDAIEDFVKIKNLKNYEGKITVQIAKERQELIIIDNGSGVIDPVWIIENPLKSRKTGISHQKGEFGRGLQGFRGFCNKLTYITLREKPNESELKHPDHVNSVQIALRKGIDVKCVRLTLTKNEIITNWEPVKIDEFRKYSNAMTGTVAIFSDWLPGEFDELIKDEKKIFERIQHHFKVPIENNVTKIYFSTGKKIEEIEPRIYEAKNEDGKMEELDLYDIPDREIINPYTKEVIGKLQIRFYQASPNYEHTYKSPFLLVGDRPLGNSILHKMDSFSNKSILKSPYLSGYVVANFLKPDSLRLAPKPGEEFKQFVIHMKDILDNVLAPQLEKYADGFKIYDRQQENTKLILQVQTFLKNQTNLRFDLMQANKIGKMSLSDSMGEEKNQRLSDVPDGENQGLITQDGTVEAVILYKKNKHKKPIVLKPDDFDPTTVDVPVKRLRIKVPTKDGQSTTTVLINPNLGSKDGRIRKQSYVGPGLDTYRGKYDRNLSKWDESKFLVSINELHETFVEYEEERKESSKYKNEAYSSKQKHLIQEQYLWHLIQRCAKDLNDEDKDREFWSAKYKFFLHKESE